MIERTLVLIKPDGVERGLIGEIIQRFEQRGLKIIGMKMQWVDKKFAEKHYTEDITKRRGQAVRDALLEFITQGPIMVIVIEGVNAVENVRKIVGGTEPKTALPGTIRGDYAHISYGRADERKIAIANLIHASSPGESEQEVKLWFTDKELHSYTTVHDKHVL
jgi:nucleoside-diphosphate kinase